MSERPCQADRREASLLLCCLRSGLLHHASRFPAFSLTTLFTHHFIKRLAGIPGWPFLFDLCRMGDGAKPNLLIYSLTFYYMTQDQIKDLKGRAEALRRYL